ncbi:MAG: pimeloyl-ACP methyl ester carboxylesterase, partial [Planctomycetota bacterium]
PAVGDIGIPADPDQGMLVWTITPADALGIATQFFYAVTTVDSNGLENRTDFAIDGNCTGQFTEGIQNPRPLKIQETVDGAGVKQHVYVQYMNLHDWNPTLTAPNAVHQDYGQNLSDPKIAKAISYAYSYVVLEPPAPVSTPLPVVLKLHPFLRDTFSPSKFLDAVSNFQLEENFNYPAIEIRPIDVGSTWWFGFAEQGFDYRAYPDECAAINAMAATAPAIHNFTEERVLRMLFDLERDTNYWAGKVDPERFYVIGHSMGGGGAIQMALRYPDRFAAAYATAPVTKFTEIVDPMSPCVTPVVGSPDCPRGFQYDIAYDIALKFGPSGFGATPFQHVVPTECQFNNPPGHIQPVVINGPGTWADHLQIYNGTPVYDWQDHGANLSSPPAGEVTPLNIRHSSTDSVVNWKFQGRPFYSQLNNGNLAWGGLVEDFLSHFKPWWFFGLSPNYSEIPGQGPFFGLSALLSETVPAMRLHVQRNSWLLPVPSSGIHIYNSDFSALPGTGAAIEWSSSWNSWDGAPIDNENIWGMSLRSLDGSRQKVDITPNRAQNFKIVAGRTYSWRLFRMNGKQVKCGCLIANADNTLTIKDVIISGNGRRLRIKEGPDLSCVQCYFDQSKAPILQASF